MLRKEENIVVLGAGISGLASIAALLAHRVSTKSDFPIQIDVIEKREFNFDRRQKLIDQSLMSEDLSWMDFAKSFFNPNNDLFLDAKMNLAGPGVNLPLTEYQSFLQKILRQEAEQKKNPDLRLNFSIKELQLALYEYIQDMQTKCKNVQIIWHENSTIQSIDLMNNTLIMQTEEKKPSGKDKQVTDAKQEIDKTQDDNANQSTPIKEKVQKTPLKYDILLLCDGAKHEGASLVNTAIDNQLPGLETFKYKSFKYQPPKYNCAVRLQFKPLEQIQGGKYKSYADIPRHKASDLKQFQEMGWKKLSVPPQFVLDDNWYKSSYDKFKPRMFVACEIPEHIYNIEDEQKRRETIIEWTKRVVAFKYGISPQDLEFDPTGEDEQHKINATTFISHMEHVNNPVIQIDDAYIVNVGDSAITPIYQAGLSSNIALNQAIILPWCIEMERENKFDRFKDFLDKFNDQVTGMKQLLKIYATAHFPPITSLYSSSISLYSSSSSPFLSTKPVEPEKKGVENKVNDENKETDVVKDQQKNESPRKDLS